MILVRQSPAVSAQSLSSATQSLSRQRPAKSGTTSSPGQSSTDSGGSKTSPASPERSAQRRSKTSVPTASLADRFDSLVAFDTVARSLGTFERERCRFGYCESVFKKKRGGYVVVSVHLALPRPWVPVLSYPGLSALKPNVALNANSVMQAVLSLRRMKLPDWRVVPNAGSFFHNPVMSADIAASFTAEPPRLALPARRRQGETLCRLADRTGRPQGVSHGSCQGFRVRRAG